MAFLTVKDHRQLHVPGFKTKCPTINDHKSLFLNNQMPYCFTIILINKTTLNMETMLEMSTLDVWSLKQKTLYCQAIVCFEN